MAKKRAKPRRRKTVRWLARDKGICEHIYLWKDEPQLYPSGRFMTEDGRRDYIQWICDSYSTKILGMNYLKPGEKCEIVITRKK